MLYADDYGFHTGNTWYRGRFRASGNETGIHLVSDSGGGAQAFSAWLNGTFLGSSTTGSANFTFPADALKSGGDNIVSVLTVNMGHEEDYNSTNGNKAARGLTSNGEQAAGDGHPITINGVTYAKGLGTNAISDVEVYLGGHCTRFTAMVGVDDEQNGAGTVTFSVAADGKTLATTPTIRGHQPATSLDVDVTGAQVMDLIVGDAGDGNGNDHGDWATPTLTCT